ncbi:hypothetical protein GGI43DRAFT_382454 [Trichoderma evansii]
MVSIKRFLLSLPIFAAAINGAGDDYILSKRAFSLPENLRYVFGPITLVIKNFDMFDVGGTIVDGAAASLGAALRDAWGDGLRSATLTAGGQDLASAVITTTPLIFGAAGSNPALLPPQIAAQTVVDTLGYAAQKGLGEVSYDLFDLAGNLVCSVVAGVD